LSDAFKQLGSTTPFSPNKADFSGMTDEPLKDALYISKIFHKSYVDVNEEGTEAAAATAVVMMKRMAIIETVLDFNCDRPFIFLIHEKSSNAILFIGKYVKP
jgi:serpin B